MWIRAICLALSLAPLAAGAQTPLALTAADGVTVFADLYAHDGARLRGTILLFHQAGGNAAEYATIAPVLAGMGFDAIAIDQRSGGDAFGGTNRTIAALGGGTAYEPALADLRAALDHAAAIAPGHPIILWGSSYSAALTLILAAEPGAADAALAFSPGEYLPTLSVGDAAARIAMPVYLTADGSGRETAAVADIAAVITAGLATVIVPDAGKHGSSNLIPAANPDGWQANWLPVTAFLDQVAP